MCARRVLIALVLWAVSFPILSRADDLICFGVRNSWKVESGTTSCGAGFNGPILESKFRSTCFNKEGSWTGSDPVCGGQSEAPKKYSYSRRGKEIERENKKIAKTKQKEEQAPSGSPDPNAAPGKNKDDQTTQTDPQGAGGKPGADGNSTVMSKADADAHRKDMDHRKDLGRQDLALEKQIETHGKDLKEDRQSLKQENAKLRDLTKERDALNKELENNNNPDLVARKEKLDKEITAQTGKVDGIKQEVTKDRKDLKAAKKEDRRLEKQQEGAADIEDIKVQKEDRAYGGLFGGAEVDTTVTINQTSDKVSKVSETGSANRVQMAGEDRAAALRLNGTTKVNVDSVNQAVQDSTKDAKAALRTSGMIDMALGMFQAFRGEEHVRSIKKVDETAETANKDVQTIHAEEMRKAEELEKRAGTEKNPTLLQEATIIRNNANESRDSTLGIVQNNQNEENDKQSNAAMIQGMEAGARLMGAADKFRQAAALQAVQAQMGGNSKQFGFGMNNGIQQTGGQDPTLVPQAQQAAVEQEAEKKAQELDQRPPLNLGDNNLAQDGPPAAAFIPTDVRPEGAGGGGGMGAAGGTSADKSAMEAGNQGPAAKASAGTYAAVAGGGYKAKNSGSGAKAGVDSGFADLLKKFLPGAEKEQAKNGPGELQFGDRSPASSQAAVIGRNKNIFEEIHKRYQKKSAEGAIMF